MKQSKNDALATVLPQKLSKSKIPSLPKEALKNPPVHVAEQKRNIEIEKENYITKILKYQSNRRFAPIINKEMGLKYTRNQLTKLKPDNLEAILHRIRTHLNNRNMEQVIEHMIKVSAKGYEDVITGFGYDITGFQSLLFENPAFHDSVQRYLIEREVPDVPPSLQILYIVASTTYMAHLNNQSLVAIREKKNEPPQPKPERIQQKKDKDEKKEIRIKSNHKPGDIII